MTILLPVMMLLGTETILLAAAVLLGACSTSTREEQAAESAKACYDLLAEGDAVRFLEGKAAADSLSADFAEQLLQAVRQYQADMERRHGGIRAVAVSPNVGRSDTVNGRPIVHAFLLLSYADSTQEEIAVPMVQHDGRWLMK